MRIATLLLFLAGALPARADEPDPDYVATDLALTKRVAALLPPSDDVPIATLLDRLDASDVDTDRDLGYGARVVRLDFYGGHGTIWLTLLVHADHVVALRIHHEIGDELTAGFERQLRAAWKFDGMVRREGGLHAEWTHPARRKTLDDAREKELGKPERPDLDGKLAEAVELLRDPLREHYYGHMYGEGGDPPDGRVALRRLLKAGARAALRDVARGPSPEGRLYAAEGLIRLGDLSEVEQRLVDAARSQKTPIVCAWGCEIVECAAAEALRDSLEEKE